MSGPASPTTCSNLNLARKKSLTFCFCVAFRYVYFNILLRYFQMGYDRECQDACRAVISSFDEHLPEPNMDLFVRVLSLYYLSTMRHDAVHGAEIAARIRGHIQTHPLFAHHFFELRHLIGMGDFKV